MGFKTWLIKRLVNSQMKKLKSGPNEDAADELLKRTLEKYTDTLKTAQKINKANLLSAKTRQLKNEVKESFEDDEDEDEDDEEEEEEEDEVEKMFKSYVLPMILNKDKLAGLDIDKLKGMAAALPPEELEKLLKNLKLR